MCLCIYIKIYTPGALNTSTPKIYHYRPVLSYGYKNHKFASFIRVRPPLLVLVNQPFSPPCVVWRWQALTSRTDSLVSKTSLSHEAATSELNHDDAINWKHFSALLAICAGNSPVTGEFPAQRPVTRSFDVLFDLHLNKRLSKQSYGWWFETPSRPLWRQSNGYRASGQTLYFSAILRVDVRTPQSFWLFKIVSLNRMVIVLNWISIQGLQILFARCHFFSQNRFRYASLNWVIIGSDNGLSPVRRQAIIWTNAGIMLIGPLGTNFSEILIGIQTFSFKKMLLKISSATWRPFCLDLNVLTHCVPVTPYGDTDLHGSDNALLPDNTKPLPEPVWTYHQWDSIVFNLRTISQEELKISIRKTSRCCFLFLFLLFLLLFSF